MSLDGIISKDLCDWQRQVSLWRIPEYPENDSDWRSVVFWEDEPYVSLNLGLEGELAGEVKGAEFKGLRGQRDENTVLT